MINLTFPSISGWWVEQKTENNGLQTASKPMTSPPTPTKTACTNGRSGIPGFGTIDENLADANNKKYVFHQDDVLKVCLRKLQIRDTQENPFAETENIWSNSQANGVTSVKLSEEKNYTHHRHGRKPQNHSNRVRIRFIRQNVTKKSERGEIAVIGDERFTYFAYDHPRFDYQHP